MHILFFKKMVVILRKSTKHAKFWVGGAVTLKVMILAFALNVNQLNAVFSFIST